MKLLQLTCLFYHFWLQVAPQQTSDHPLHHNVCLYHFTLASPPLTTLLQLANLGAQEL